MELRIEDNGRFFKKNNKEGMIMSRPENTTLLVEQQHADVSALVAAKNATQKKMQDEQTLLNAIKANTTVKHAAYMTLLAIGSAARETGAFVKDAVKNNPVKTVIQLGMVAGLVASELTGVFDKNPSSTAKDAEGMGQDVNNMARTQAAKYTGALVGAAAAGVFTSRVNAHYDRRLLEEEAAKTVSEVTATATATV